MSRHSRATQIKPQNRPTSNRNTGFLVEKKIKYNVIKKAKSGKTVGYSEHNETKQRFCR